MANIFTKIFGTYSDHQIKKLMPTVHKIEALAPEMKKLTDSEMAEMTPKFKERLAAGETLDDILPEAYALVREAADRVLGKRPFMVQLLCGIVHRTANVRRHGNGDKQAHGRPPCSDSGYFKAGSAESISARSR